MKLVFFTRRLDLDDSRIGFAHVWAEKLAERCEKLYVICLEKGRIELPGNVEVFDLGKGKARRYLRFNRIMNKIAPDFDAVFCHMNPIYSIISAPQTKLRGKKLVMWYAHGSTSLKLKVAARLSDKILTSSKDGFRLKSDKTVIIGQAIDTEKFKPRKKNAKNPVLLTIGRMSPVKRYETLLKAMPRVLEKYPKAELRIVANAQLPPEKEYLKSLKELASSLKIDKSVKFMEGVPFAEVPQLYDDSDIFVSDSQTGSLDKVVLEAMSSGRPVLISNKAFVPELGDLASRFVFQPGDDKELAAKALRILGSKDTKAVGKLREIVESRHSIDRFITRVIKEAS